MVHPFWGTTESLVGETCFISRTEAWWAALHAASTAKKQASASGGFGRVCMLEGSEKKTVFFGP
jgi:hypothetical protein